MAQMDQPIYISAVIITADTAIIVLSMIESNVLKTWNNVNAVCRVWSNDCNTNYVFVAEWGWYDDVMDEGELRVCVF